MVESQECQWKVLVMGPSLVNIISLKSAEDFVGIFRRNVYKRVLMLGKCGPLCMAILLLCDERFFESLLYISLKASGLLELLL